MPAELRKLGDPDTTAINLWPNKMKSASIQGVELAKAMQEFAKTNMMDNKPIVTCKKSCVCAPTNHAGSFRCRLHRTGAAHKSSSSSCSIAVDSSGKNCLNFNSRNMILQRDRVHGQTRLSRFGRAASAGAPHDVHPLRRGFDFLPSCDK